jgi:hypothetical protein
MNQPKKCSAIKSLLFSALMLCAALASAAPGVGAGTVARTAGPLLASRADGSSKILAPKSTVQAGDTLTTQKNGYAQIGFSDGSQIILSPGTILTIDKFSYDADKPEADRAAFTLQQGGLRLTAGLIGKRSLDRVTLTTPVARIDMQNGSAVIQYYPESASAQAAAQAAQYAWLMASTAALDMSPSLTGSQAITRTDAPAVMAIRPMTLAQLTPPPAAPRPPGLYVQVLDGLIHVTNPSGTSNFSAGQFGYTPTITQPPVVLPANPGMQFTPPPHFTSSTTSSAPTGPTKSNTVDCEVR